MVRDPEFIFFDLMLIYLFANSIFHFMPCIDGTRSCRPSYLRRVKNL